MLTFLAISLPFLQAPAEAQAIPRRASSVSFGEMVILCSGLMRCEEGDTIICYLHAHGDLQIRHLLAIWTHEHQCAHRRDVKGRDRALTSRARRLSDVLRTGQMNTS